MLINKIVIFLGGIKITICEKIAWLTLTTCVVGGRKIIYFEIMNGILKLIWLQFYVNYLLI